MIKNNNLELILKRIAKGIEEYEMDLKDISDEELYDLVYLKDYDPEDPCSVELERRGIGKCDCSGDMQVMGCPAKDCCIWERGYNRKIIKQVIVQLDKEYHRTESNAEEYWFVNHDGEKAIAHSYYISFYCRGNEVNGRILQWLQNNRIVNIEINYP